MSNRHEARFSSFRNINLVRHRTLAFSDLLEVLKAKHVTESSVVFKAFLFYLTLKIVVVQTLIAAKLE